MKWFEWSIVVFVSIAEIEAVEKIRELNEN